MIQRSFMPGSKWVYYKIYLGPKTTDSILTEVILSQVEELIAKNIIDKWFFIRYADPKHHLRLRFYVSNIESITLVVNSMFSELQSCMKQDIIWKVQLDTYNRELERYGTNTMELSESLFCHDSWATVQFLDLIEGDEGENLRWLYGLRAIDCLLNAFRYSIDEKMQLMESLKTGFGREFNMSRPLKKQLDSKYRKERESIEHFMIFTKEQRPDYEPILDILEKTFASIQPIAQSLLKIEKNGDLQMTKDGLIGSYIHMLMNRLFKSKNRLNEMVCYDFLFRYYKTTKAKSKTLQHAENQLLLRN